MAPWVHPGPPFVDTDWLPFGASELKIDGSGCFILEHYWWKFEWRKVRREGRGREDKGGGVEAFGLGFWVGGGFGWDC